MRPETLCAIIAEYFPGHAVRVLCDVPLPGRQRGGRETGGAKEKKVGLEEKRNGCVMRGEHSGGQKEAREKKKNWHGVVPKGSKRRKSAHDQERIEKEGVGGEREEEEAENKIKREK